MPTWRNSLPPQGKHQGYDLKRTPATGSLQAIITCEEMVVCDTHYWHGRTMPCERISNEEGSTIDDSNCQACTNKQPYRTHAYVSALNPKTHEHFLFECTGTAAKPLEEYFQAAGTLRGCIINATRPKGGPNSKVVIITNTANQARVQLPNAPDLPRALAVIWRLPQTAVNPQEETNQEIRTAAGYATKQTTIHTDAQLLHDVRTQEDNAGSEIAFLARREAFTKEVLENAAKKTKPINGKKVKCSTVDN